MDPDQLHPLQVNPQTQEPFLRLRKHENIILTPMRWQDAPHMVPIFNDVRVCNWMASPPFPFTLEDAEDWLAKRKPPVDNFLQHLKDAQGSESLVTAKGAPICSIREVNEDGTDLFIGVISFVRLFYGELMNTKSVDFERAEQNVAENSRLDVGDPRIIWSIGDFLAPSHHRQGIMTDAVDTLLHEWAIPRMGVRRIIVGAFTGNDGSVKVFEKNGFKHLRTIAEFKVIKGKMRGLHVLEWTSAESLEDHSLP
ncbi:acyl-CoA N-acyltransferase [Pholiota conissans]|uniref:Acyl-CoA N-acyltransferase n=1 Tax=Pholiota conissans TaxID=109636 RepID=A0A9P5ZF79_9AGAR|nr:acyl-CoA N-acyltransferase [Pholiota conissans]